MNYDVVNLRGHGNGDSGAVGNGYKEVDLAQQFVDRINVLVRNKGVTVLTNTYYQNNFEICVLNGHNITKHFGYELHLNSGDETSNGIEIIVPSKEKYLSSEKSMIDKICKETGLTNRGLKSRNYDTGQFFFREDGEPQTFTDYYKTIRDAWSRGVSLSIIELGFISNARDVKILLEKKEVICKIIANTILSYCNKSLYEISDNKNEEVKERYKMKYAVCYCNEVDERSAKLLRDYLGDETQSLDARIKMNWNGLAEKGLINIGGNSSSGWGFSSYATHWIKGDNRYSTTQLVSDICSGKRKLDEFKIKK